MHCTKSKTERAVHLNLILDRRKSMFPVMDGARGIDEIDDVGIVFVRCEMKREEILVQTHWREAKRRDCGCSAGSGQLLARRSVISGSSIHFKRWLGDLAPVTNR